MPEGFTLSFFIDSLKLGDPLIIEDKEVFNKPQLFKNNHKPKIASRPFYDYQNFDFTYSKISIGEAEELLKGQPEGYFFSAQDNFYEISSG